MHSGKGQQHSGKSSPSATLGEEPPRMPLTGKRPSPRAKNRALGEAFPECRLSTRGRFDAVGAVRCFFFEKNSSPSATLGEEICFFLKPSSPSASLRHSGKDVSCCLLKPSSPSAIAQALGEATSNFKKNIFF
jgi:hypothetical protein